MKVEFDLTRLMGLRKKLFDAIEFELFKCGHYKGYEGRFDVGFFLPSYFEEEGEPTWNLHLACYVIGPTRGYDWSGKNLDEIIRVAERDILLWIEESRTCYNCDWHDSMKGCIRDKGLCKFMVVTKKREEKE